MGTNTESMRLFDGSSCPLTPIEAQNLVQALAVHYDRPPLEIENWLCEAVCIKLPQDVSFPGFPIIVIERTEGDEL
jgi:hypothetical protein